MRLDAARLRVVLSKFRAHHCAPSELYCRVVGFPERLVDRQMMALRGSRAERLRQLERHTRTLGWAAIINAVGTAYFLAVSDDLWVRTMWTVIGAFWLPMGYVVMRQRRYLRTLAGGG